MFVVKPETCTSPAGSAQTRVVLFNDWQKNGSSVAAHPLMHIVANITAASAASKSTFIFAIASTHAGSRLPLHS
jgi:hypothetical protein